MANIQQGGFRYVFSSTHGVPQEFTRELASGYGTAVAPGDVIIQVSDGTVAIAGATDEPFGIVTAVSYVLSGKRTPALVIPASTSFTPSTVGSVAASYVTFIPTIPSVNFFEVDADDGTTFTTIATQISALGENCSTTTGTPDATTGTSGFSLDISTHAVTESLVWRIVDIVKRSDNDPTVTRYKFIVTANHSGWPSAATNRVGI